MCTSSVAGGALSDDGTRGYHRTPYYLVPVFALSKVYRAKVRDALKEAGLLEKFPEAVWQDEWVVHSKAVGDGPSCHEVLGTLRLSSRHQ